MEKNATFTNVNTGIINERTISHDKIEYPHGEVHIISWEDKDKVVQQRMFSDYRSAEKKYRMVINKIIKAG